MSCNCIDCQGIHNTTVAEPDVYETKLADRDAEIARLKAELALCMELTNGYHDVFERQLGQHVQGCRAYDTDLNMEFVRGLFEKFSAIRGETYHKLKALEATKGNNEKVAR